jgi:hypothetical protein
MKPIMRLLVVLVLSVSLGACAAPPELAENYSGSLAGVPLSIDYSSGWTVMEMSANTMAIVYDEDTGMTLASGLPFVPSTENMDVMLFSVFNRYANFLGDLTVISEPEDVRIDGVAARQMVFEGTEGDGETSIPVRFLLIAGGDETVDFSIEARSPVSGWESAEPFFNAMISSIVFNQPEA